MEVKERKKVESCKSIETKQQLRWESHKVFETDAPKPGTDQWKQVGFFKIPNPNQKILILAKILYLLSISLYEWSSSSWSYFYYYQM